MTDFDNMPYYEEEALEYRLTKAEILYHKDDEPHLLQSFLWKDYDTAPDYPELQRFLEIFRQHIDGSLHSVRVESLEEVRPPEYIYATVSTAIH